jgi:hypothetical protein
VINYLSNHSDLKVNDDMEELYWEKLLTLFMDGSFQDEEAERIFDELTGKEIDSGEVRKARGEEIEFIRQLKVYEEVPEKDCWENTGRGPIGTR